MAGDATAEVASMLAAAGRIAGGDQLRLVPLSGGVSCDVWRVDRDGQPIAVVKRALAQLRVKADWFAPVERTESEVEWLRVAHGIVPHLAPEILAQDKEAHMFAMVWLSPDRHPVWKDELFAGRVDVTMARAVGRDLALVHQATAGRAGIAASFDTMAQFDSLRIDPFLRFTAGKHPAAAPRLLALADGLSTTRIALVHGDVSPKNILLGADGPVLLDAECAVYGDPAFDAAFCLAHLLLKLVHFPEAATSLRQSAAALAEAWLAGISFEDRSSLSKRTADLVAALILARIDGKSPAPYITDSAEQQRIRAAALRLLGNEPMDLARLIAGWPQQQGMNA